MEKVSIKYSVNNIVDIKNTFEKNNNTILEKLKELEKEYGNIKEVLSTPNSDKIMPELQELIKNYDNGVTEKGLYFDKVFNSIIKEYDEFMMKTGKAVGGDK